MLERIAAALARGAVRGFFEALAERDKAEPERVVVEDYGRRDRIRDAVRVLWPDGFPSRPQDPAPYRQAGDGGDLGADGIGAAGPRESPR